MHIGEVWVTPGNMLLHADHAGEDDHESLAIEHARYLLCEIFKIEHEEWMLDTEINSQIAQRARPNSEAGHALKEGDTYLAANLICKKENDYTEELHRIANGNGCIRIFAMQHWNWHAIRNHNAETWRMTTSALEAIRDGWLKIASEEWDEGPEDAFLPSTKFYIEAQNQQYLRISWEDLLLGNFTRPSKTAHQPDCCAAVAQLDRMLLSPCYAGFGD